MKNYSEEELNRAFIESLSFVKENKKIFKASFNNPSGMKAKNKYNHLKDYILNPILDRLDLIKESYTLDVYAKEKGDVKNEW